MVLIKLSIVSSSGVSETSPSRGTLGVAGHREARVRVPEDRIGAVQRPEQLQEHTGVQQGAEGGLGLGVAAAVRTLQQPARRGECSSFDLVFALLLYRLFLCKFIDKLM